MMSDLHFDPMADPKLVDRLSSAEPEEWQAIFESSDNKTPAQYGADSNWALLHSALRQTKQTLPNPAFVVLPGDFLAHNFRRRCRCGPFGCGLPNVRTQNDAVSGIATRADLPGGADPSGIGQ